MVNISWPIRRRDFAYHSLITVSRKRKRYLRNPQYSIPRQTLWISKKTKTQCPQPPFDDDNISSVEHSFSDSSSDDHNCSDDTGGHDSSDNFSASSDDILNSSVEILSDDQDELDEDDVSSLAMVQSLPDADADSDTDSVVNDPSSSNSALQNTEAVPLQNAFSTSGMQLFSEMFPCNLILSRRS